MTEQPLDDLKGPGGVKIVVQIPTDLLARVVLETVLYRVQRVAWLDFEDEAPLQVPDELANQFVSP